MNKTTRFYRKTPSFSLVFRGFSTAALFLVFALLFSGCNLMGRSESGKGGEEILLSNLSIEIAGGNSSIQPGNTLTFTVKRNGEPVTPDNAEVSRNGDKESGGSSISIDPVTGELTLNVAVEENAGYNVLTVTAACKGSFPVTASVTVQTPETYFTEKGSAQTFIIDKYTGTAAVVVIPPVINGKTVTGIAKAAFMYDPLQNPSGPKLASVIIPDSVKSIGEQAFQANELTSIIIPENVTSIGRDAFKSNQLTSVTIPEKVSVEEGAFHENPLSSISIGEIVTIGNFAFGAGTNDLKYVHTLGGAGTYIYSGNNIWTKQGENP
jgi:hypothetical protein